jgi:hypothetical protein
MNITSFNSKIVEGAYENLRIICELVGMNAAATNSDFYLQSKSN